MAASPPDLAARFRGSLLGLTVGDALGAPFEGWMPEAIRASHPTPQRLVEHPPVDRAHRRASPRSSLGRPRASSTTPTTGRWPSRWPRPSWRGPRPPDLREPVRGRVPVLARLRPRRPPHDRPPPPGRPARRGRPSLVPRRLVRQRRGHAGGAGRAAVLPRRRRARRARHPLGGADPRPPRGVDGAQAIAAAVAWAATAEAFDRDALFDHASAAVTTDAMKERLEAARRVAPGDLLSLGHGIRAVDSVPTAIACFATHPSSCPRRGRDGRPARRRLRHDRRHGGGIAGAFLGDRAIPQAWLDVLEDDANGRTAIADLATRLAAAV